MDHVNPTPGSRIMVAMSGGVDSSVAAALLQRDGFEVIGVTMKLWGGDSDSGCCSVSDVDDARRVAQQLGIDHHVFNFGDEFDAHVVEPYVADHVAGRTPNPCVECNRHIKFDKLLRRADALGFDFVATGHHARRVDKGDHFRIARGEDAQKDQSYVLYPLIGVALARTLFPLGEMTKPQVRSLAEEIGLRTANKPDSQDVCFIAKSNGGRSAFLGERIPLRPATIVDVDGERVGELDSVELVTIGQRRGLDVGGPGGRRYVVDVNPNAGVVTIGGLEDLLRETVLVNDLVWADPAITAERLQTMALGVQCSAHGRPLPATAQIVDDAVEVRWVEPQRRVAPGQSVVLYDGDEVIAGGLAD
ncbi:MAG: tRNA 2-thiouridine(34) synthase MnmA [Actinobacteria bacterium]|nr:tRNA 2-thiouridine(34) synthase MnmA [Actinomycetota bacterium]